MSDERREVMIAHSMLTVGNARSCFTEDEILRGEEGLKLAETITTEWNPSTNISLAHPKIGFCAAFATLTQFMDAKISKDNMQDIVSFMDRQALRMCQDEQYLKKLSNHLLTTPFSQDFLNIINFTNNMRQTIRKMGSAEDAARITLAVYCPQLFDFGCEDRVFVKTSSIHGNGLFAAKCISRGEIVTMYPSSILRIGEANDANEKRLSMGSYATELENYAFNVDNLFTNFSVPVYILPSTERCAQPRAGQMGHLINAANKYTTALSTFDVRINCMPVSILANTCIAFIATKEIAKDSELLTHYSLNYNWNTSS